jgi:ABC-type glycerol-3-phosphate transport system permease component
MKILETIKNPSAVVNDLKNDKQFANDRKKAITMCKTFVLSLLRFVIIVGISYIILGPIITVVSRSFFSAEDVYNPVVYLFPQAPTLGNFRLSWLRMDYVKTLLHTLGYVLLLMMIQILVTSMVGYGFARFNFPFKKLLFAGVIITIVVPTHTIMLPLYMYFRKFDPAGIISLIQGVDGGINLLAKRIPMFIMTIFGVGLRSGLYIYIFNQFFRGLPKEIEEAAFIDGAGPWYTYFKIMLVNAIPSVITVAVFSLVWQYNDMFYSKLFLIDSKFLISKKITTLQATISNLDRLDDPTLTQLYLYAGIVLTILPVVLLYVLLQRYFMEGVERSGIVG